MTKQIYNKDDQICDFCLTQTTYLKINKTINIYRNIISELENILF